MIIHAFPCPFKDGQIVLTGDKRFGRVWIATPETFNSWLIQVQFADGSIETYHSDLLSYPPKPRLVWQNSIQWGK